MKGSHSARAGASKPGASKPAAGSAKAAPAKGSAKSPPPKGTVAKAAESKKPAVAKAAGNKGPQAKGASPVKAPPAKGADKSAKTSSPPASNGKLSPADKAEGKKSPKGSSSGGAGANAPAAGGGKAGLGKPVTAPVGKQKVASTAPAIAGKGAKGTAKADAKADPKAGQKDSSKDGQSKGQPKGKSKDGAETAAADKAKAAPAASKSKSSPKKKGPIDLATAKSVAAVAAASQADSSGYVIINGRRVRMISTKGLPAPRRTKVVVEKEIEKHEPLISSIKTKMNKKELDEYKALLMLKRRQLIGMLHGMEDEALRSSGGNLSTMPLHMADIGTDTFDQDFTLGMAETERALLDEIDAALKRIDNKTYGVCQLSGKPIPKTRLEAKPWAKYSIEAAKLMERGSGSR